MYIRAVEIMENNLGSDHPDAIIFKRNLEICREERREKDNE